MSASFRIDRSDKSTPLVARLFSKARPFAAVEADLAVLRYLAQVRLPRRATVRGGATQHPRGPGCAGQRVRQAGPKAKRPDFPISSLGAMVGGYRVWPYRRVPIACRGAAPLRGGDDGRRASAVAGWLDAIEGRVPSGSSAALSALRDAVPAQTAVMAPRRAAIQPGAHRRSLPRLSRPEDGSNRGQELRLLQSESEAKARRLITA